MRNLHIDEWVNLLASTDERQCTSHLCTVTYGDGIAAFCCLGLGSAKLVPNMDISWPTSEDWHYDDTHDEDDQPLSDGSIEVKTALFGEVAEGDLAPREFIEWLGYTINDDDTSAGWDVHIDWPEHMRERSNIDLMNREYGGDTMSDEQGDLLISLTAATLNDHGFTFAQIGDIIGHFGLFDRLSRS